MQEQSARRSPVYLKQETLHPLPFYIVLRYNRDMKATTNSPESERLQTLAEFRYELRKFLHFSEQRSTEAGLQPQQHQMLLQIAGAPPTTLVTVSYVAERLGLRHHTTVELSKRGEEAGLVRRSHDATDRRCVVLELTASGRKMLGALAEDHARELYELAPTMIRALTRIRNSREQPAIIRSAAGGR
jgi:DNA-binding MarR family transcriptional regulator